MQQQLPFVSSSAKRCGICLSLKLQRHCYLLEFRVAKAQVFELLRKQQRFLLQPEWMPAYDTLKT